MYKVTAKTKGYDRIEFVFDNMNDAAEFMRIAMKNVVSERFACNVEEFDPVCDISQE